MSSMSDYITKLESFPDLEVSIIRQTKINKVLKAILKLEVIPKEAEFQFKERSQVLLDKWNKLLNDVPLAPPPEPAPANGINGTSEAPAAPAVADAPNGVKKETAEPEAPKPAPEEPKAEVRASRSLRVVDLPSN